MSIKKVDLSKCEEEFTDIDRLKIALEICESNNSNGIIGIKYHSNDNTSSSNDLNRNDNRKTQNVDNVKYPSIYKYFH